MKSVHSLMDMSGKVAMVTGATGNLGHVIAETIAELNGSLVLLDKPNSNFDLITDRLKKNFDIKILCYECDFECEKSRNSTFHTLSKDIDSLNCLINNAAFTSSSNLDGWSCPFEEQSIFTMKRAFEVNLTAVFHLSKTITPILKKTGKGSIINISSIYGKYAPDWSLYQDTTLSNPAGYALSKAAIDQLTRWLATTIAPEIRVNAISPGGIYRKQDRNFVNKYSQKTPLGRMACENDLKGAIAYLASDLSEYVTGQILEVNGGWGI